MDTRQERIRAALIAAFAPEALDVADESARHAGHAGVRHAERGPAGVGETHYAVSMTAAAFAGQSRLARQRAVNEALRGEFAGGLHALSLALKAPGE